MQQLQRLVALPTVSSSDPALDMSNGAIVAELAGWLEALGFDVRLMDVADGKQNLIATAGQGSDGLVLAGHTDTVPFNEEYWHSNPFELMERDGRCYGLGVTDMKCFFPIILKALADLDLKRLARPLTVLATADEESSMAGARALQEAGERLGSVAVIGEPTGLKPIVRHKGVMWLALRVVGQSGHASNPALGRNALNGMHRVIAALLAWHEGLIQRYHDPAFDVPVPTLNLGRIAGGDSPNRICAHCELQFDMRILPGMDADELVDQIRYLAEEAVAGQGLSVSARTLMPAVPPMQTDVRCAAVSCAERWSGHSAGTVGFGTEAPFLTALGTDTIILGAGDIDQAHQPDEYLDLERVDPMVAMTRKFVQRFCIDD